MEDHRPEDLAGPPLNQLEPQRQSATKWTHFTMVKVDRKKTPKIIIDMTQEQRRQEDFNKLYYTVRKLKTEGIHKFYAGLYDDALKCYETAEEICEAINPDSEDRKQAVYQIHQEVCIQASLTYFKLRRYQNAVRYSQLGVEIPGKNDLKAESHFWWAKALFALERFEDCRIHLLEAKRLDSTIQHVDAILEEVNGKIVECDRLTDEMKGC